MTAVQIHLRAPEPEAVAPTALGWKSAGRLSGWRDDDPDAYPRCSVNPEHVIRNGDHYAIAGIKLACAPCARLAPPRAPVERAAPARTPAAPRAAVAATVAPKTAARPEPVLTQPAAVVASPAPRRARVYPAPFNETRTCERQGCEQTFTVKADNRKKRFCSNSCARFAMHANRPPRPPVRIAPVEASVCAQCGAEHQPISTRPLHCSWACVWLSAAAPASHGLRCFCIACADGRLAMGMSPLIGLVAS